MFEPQFGFVVLIYCSLIKSQYKGVSIADFMWLRFLSFDLQAPLTLKKIFIE